MNKAKEDEQKKITEAHANKMEKNHASFSRISRPNGRGGVFPNQYRSPEFSNLTQLQQLVQLEVVSPVMNLQ